MPLDSSIRFLYNIADVSNVVIHLTKAEIWEQMYQSRSRSCQGSSSTVIPSSLHMYLCTLEKNNNVFIIIVIITFPMAKKNMN